MTEDDAVCEAFAAMICRYGYTAVLGDENKVTPKILGNQWKHGCAFDRVLANPLRDPSHLQSAVEAELIHLEYVARFFGVADNTTTNPICIQTQPCHFSPHQYIYIRLAVQDTMLGNSYPRMSDDDRKPLEQLVRDRFAATQETSGKQGNITTSFV